MKQYYTDVAVVGGGPAGLAAALAANREGAQVMLLEREGRLGGILKQCIHDGFGLVRFGEKLTGPEYAGRFLDQIAESGIEVMTLAFVSGIDRTGSGYQLRVIWTLRYPRACGCAVHRLPRTHRKAGFHSRGPAQRCAHRRRGAALCQSARPAARAAMRDPRFGRHRADHGAAAHP